MISRNVKGFVHAMHRTWAILFCLTFCLSCMIGTVSAAEEKTQPNQFDNETSLAGSYMVADPDRPGTFVSGGTTGADTGKELFTLPSASRSFTYSGHIKIVSIGQEGWAGVRLIFGNNGAASKALNEVVITRTMNVRINFMGLESLQIDENTTKSSWSNTKDVLPTLAADTEFDFRIVRDEYTVTLSINGVSEDPMVIPADNDAFTASLSNIGVEGAKCVFELSDVVITYPEKLPNLFDNETAIAGSYMVPDNSRPGTFVSGGDSEADTGKELFTLPAITKNFSYSGHVKILSVGEEGWAGVRLIFSAVDEKVKDELLITKGWGVRFDFKGKDYGGKMWDKSGLRLSENAEFDFEVVRKNDTVTLYLNGVRYGTFDIPAEDDAFTEGSTNNIGIEGAKCRFELSNIAVTCADVEITPPEPPATDKPDTESPSPSPSNNPSNKPSTDNPPTGEGSILPYLMIICAAAAVAVIAVRAKRAGKES